MGLFKDRKNQKAVTVKLKLVAKRKWQRDYLNRLFREVTWLRNWTISKLGEGEIDWSQASKIHEVDVKVGSSFESRKLEVLASQMKQAVQCEVLQNLTSLSRLKENGSKVGKLKFQREHRVLYLTPQMFSFRTRSHIRFCKLKKGKSFYIRGFKQLDYWKSIDPDLEFGDSKLLKKASGYYLHLTIWVNKEKYSRLKKDLFDSIGIDFGIKCSLTCSNGIQINIVNLEKPKRLKRLHRKLSKCRKGSKNRKKASVKLKKNYEKWCNKKEDVRNRIFSYFKAFKQVAFQDETIHEWKSWFGKQIESTTIGSIVECLKQRHSGSVVVDKWKPTTKTCSKCSNVKETVTLDQRVFECDKCNFKIDRDLNSAKNMLKFVGLEQTEVTPMEYETAARIFGPSPYVLVSFVR